jgi:hypothetical protein
LPSTNQLTFEHSQVCESIPSGSTTITLGTHPITGYQP